MIQPVLLSTLCRTTLLLSLAAPVAAQTSRSPVTPGEARASRALEAAAKMGAPELYAFLRPMPKGADLHMHLSGAVYAETFIAEAARTSLCVGPVDPGTPAIPEGQNAVRFIAPGSKGCAPGQVTAAAALKRQPLYDSLIDSFSMRAFVPTQSIDGHDQFFATFDRFGGLKDDSGEWLDEVATRAAAQNEQYLEIMQTPTFSGAAALGYKIGWPDPKFPGEQPDFAKLRDALLAGGLRDEVATDSKQLADAKADRLKLEDCSAKDHIEPACGVTIHWLYQVLRGFPPQQVFAQTVLGFEVAAADPDVVGINFVMPEDGRISMQDYALQMEMLDYLHSVYPQVHISLHAGELAPGLVPPAGLSFHIRDAIDRGHAERIGHGVDVLYEIDPQALLKEMADKHIMVEVNLTSNAVILGIKGKDHPLAAYRAAHVPFALSTDDEGVSRIDLTHEYVRAVADQGLTYADLKLSARTSLEHAFLHGESLWAAPDSFTRRKPACVAAITAVSHPVETCAAFLAANEKARLQYDLELRFSRFESAIQAAPVR
jgi:adenosine deaminase